MFHVVEIPSITLEMSSGRGGKGVTLMSMSRIQEVRFPMSYSRWYTCLDLDVSNTNEAPAKRVGGHDLESSLKPFIE